MVYLTYTPKARGLRVNISGIPQVPMLQILCNTFTPKIKGIHKVLAMFAVITFIVWAMHFDCGFQL